MTPRRILSHFLLVLFLAGLAGCGSDDDDSLAAPGGNTGGSSGPADVGIDQLAGTWFGSFDDTNSVRNFEFTIDADAIADIKLNGTDTRLTGTLTKASEIPRAFRFVLTSNGAEISRGIMLADPSATYVAYLDRFFEFGVLQKGATALPAYAQADIDGAWVGDTVKATTDFTTLTSESASADCAATTPATTSPSSQCTMTIGPTNRAATNVVLDDAAGRWLGTFADTPPPATAPANVAIRAFLSADKNFSGWWACHNFAGGFPETCDFSAWARP